MRQTYHTYLIAICMKWISIRQSTGSTRSTRSIRSSRSMRSMRSMRSIRSKIYRSNHLWMARVERGGHHLVQKRHIRWLGEIHQLRGGGLHTACFSRSSCLRTRFRSAAQRVPRLSTPPNPPLPPSVSPRQASRGQFPPPRPPAVPRVSCCL